MLAVYFILIASVLADDFSLVGTWSSKSNTVFTGPGFYDPVDELLIEPDLPGISYSFTEDGYFEEAVYQITPNPQNITCPSAVLIYQHGRYTENANGSLTLEPFAVDGRQLLSQPCQDNGTSTYSRFSQVEAFRNYELSIDDFHGRYKLQLYEAYGRQFQPLYLAYRPPLMLPTVTMNPTGADSPRETGLKLKVKRSLENRYKTNSIRQPKYNYDLWWWISVGLVVGGSTLYIVC